MRLCLLAPTSARSCAAAAKAFSVKNNTVYGERDGDRRRRKDSKEKERQRGREGGRDGGREGGRERKKRRERKSTSPERVDAVGSIDN